jgi:hypothetical protein
MPQNNVLQVFFRVTVIISDEEQQIKNYTQYYMLFMIVDKNFQALLCKYF